MTNAFEKRCVSFNSVIQKLPTIMTELAARIVTTKTSTMAAAMPLLLPQLRFSLVLYTVLNEFIIDTTPCVEA